MNITIHDKAILIERLAKWIESMQYVHDNRRDMYWRRCEMVKGKVVVHPSPSWSKNLFKTGYIDRHQKTLDAIKENNLHNIDWIDFRDVLYRVCFGIDMLGSVSYKQLRESHQDLTIHLTGDTEKFETFIKSHTQLI